MSFNLGWFIFFLFIQSNHGSNHDGHCPNHWWKHEDTLCIQLDDGHPDDFDGALRTCSAWTDADANIHEFLDIHEDWSLLITISRLNLMISSSTKALKPKVWVNAIWFENQWYQIIRVNIEARLIREYIDQGDAELIPMADLETLHFKQESYENGDSLIYDPFHNEVSKRTKGDGSFHFICTHQKEKKHKEDVSIKVFDKDDVPLKKASVFIDRKSASFTTDSDGEVELGEIEVGTPLVISVGNAADYVLGQKTVTISKDMTLPIKINLLLEQRDVVFTVLDGSGAALDGVDIKVNGASIGTTDSDGKLSKMYGVTEVLNYESIFTGYLTESGTITVEDNGGNDNLVNIVMNPVTYTDNAACTDGDWAKQIVSITTAATLDACKEVCNTEGDNCDFIAFEGTECGVGRYQNDGTEAVTASTPTLSFKNNLLSNAKDEFVSTGIFSSILTWHHRLFKKPIKVASQEECAFQCLTSCGINQECDFFSYQGGFCTLGNLAYQIDNTDLDLDKDCIPPLDIMYNKNKVADIQTKLAGTDRGSCTGGAANIVLTAGGSFEVEPTDTSGDCLFYVFNDNPGSVKLTLTSTTFFTAPAAKMSVYIGGDKATGIRICELTNAANTCQWFDALAVIEYEKKIVGSDAGARATIENIP